MAPLMLTAVAEGRLTLPRMVDLDADWTYDRRHALPKSRDNMAIYDGVRMRGRVVSTFVRGVRVFDEGAITGPAGHGRFVRPA